MTVWVQFRSPPFPGGLRRLNIVYIFMHGLGKQHSVPFLTLGLTLKNKIKKNPHAVCIIYILGHQIFSFQPWIIPFIVFQCLVLGNVLLFSMQFRNMPKICLQK